MGKAHRKEMAASCHFRHNWFLGAVKNGFQVQLGVSRKLTAPLRGFLLDAILQHRSDGVTGASRSFWETPCTLRGFCQSLCSLNCVAWFCFTSFKILKGALMSVSNLPFETQVLSPLMAVNGLLNSESPEGANLLALASFKHEFQRNS